VSCLLGGVFKQLRMGDFHEQRVCTKYYIKLGKVFSETFEMLKQAFRDAPMSRTKTHERYIRFKESQLQLRTMTAQDNGQHKKMKKNILKVRKVIRSNRHLTVK